jgi:hypothetical protein
VQPTPTKTNTLGGMPVWGLGVVVAVGALGLLAAAAVFTRRSVRASHEAKLIAELAAEESNL